MAIGPPHTPTGGLPSAPTEKQALDARTLINSWPRMFLADFNVFYI